MNLKHFLLTALCVVATVGAKAQDWTWVGETPVAKGSYYLFNKGANSFIVINENGAPENSAEPMLFTLTEGLDGTDLQYTVDGTNYYLYQSAGTYGCFQDGNTTVRTDRSTDKMNDFGESYRWKIKTYGTGYQIYSNHKYNEEWWSKAHRNDTDRYITYNVSTYSCSKNSSEYNTDDGTWLFISETQYQAYMTRVKEGTWTNKNIYTVTENGDYVFFNRGANWGTQANYTTNYDESKKLDITVSNYMARFKYTDTNKYLFDAGGYNLYTDKDDASATNTAFCMSEQVNGGYKLVLPIDPRWSVGLGKDGDYDVLKLVPTAEAPVWNFCDAKAAMAVNSTAKYGTFCAPFAVTVPSGVEASTAKLNGNGSTIDLEPVGATIPANTPVILYAESGLAATTLYGAAVAGTPTAGSLTGVYTATTAQDGWYVLQNNDNKVGFYKVNTATATPTIGANRCYLTTSGKEARAFFFDEETAISAIEALTTGTAEIYSLDGTKTSSLRKGVNIIRLTNGKTQKVIVK